MYQDVAGNMFNMKRDIYNSILNDLDLNIHYPDTINVHEYRAPTDESIRLMEEMHHKALKNIIAKIDVDNNLVTGKCWLIEQPLHIDNYKIVVKFKINNTEFSFEKECNRSEFFKEGRLIGFLNEKLQNIASSILLTYMLKMFTVEAYKQITGDDFPKEILKRL